MARYFLNGKVVFLVSVGQVTKNKHDVWVRHIVLQLSDEYRGLSETRYTM